MPSAGCDIPDLYEALERLLWQIPRGCVTTYGDLAEALGSRTAARWVGEYLLDHPHRQNCPCHRVVRSTGRPGLYIGGNSDEKRRRLESESIELPNGRVDLDACRFRNFETTGPLATLITSQEQLLDRVCLKAFPSTPEVVAGVDLSYSPSGEAIGAYALIETAGGRTVWSTTIRQPVRFPYIPGFLAFREMPVLLALLEQVERERKMAELLFVDGHGRLHHRLTGIATHLGVLAGVATIGIGKKLLCGSVDLEGLQPGDGRPVIYRDSVVGMALKASQRSRPIFVSSGQLIDLDDAVRMTRLSFHGHRLPEPVFQADTISRRVARDG